MGTTHVPVQQPQPTPVNTGAVTNGQSVPNDQAAAAAAAARSKSSAAALLATPWGAALGMIPPDGGKPTLHKDEKLRSETYRLATLNIPGRDKAQTYLADVAPGPAEALLRDVFKNSDRDKQAFTQIRTSVATICHAGTAELGPHSLQILSSIALLTDDGKKYLRDFDWKTPDAVIGPLGRFIEGLQPNDPSRETYEGIRNHLLNPYVPGAAGADKKPKQLSEEEEKKLKLAADALYWQIQQELEKPEVAENPKQATQAVLGKINAADAQVREYLYGKWRDSKGKSILELLNTKLPGTQVEKINAALDPVERLYQDCHAIRNSLADAKGPPGSEFSFIRTFLQNHLDDKAVRLRVQMHAPLMQQYVQWWPNDKRKILLRMIVTGKEEPDAIDRLHDAADAKDSLAAIKAIYEIGSSMPGKLAELRSDPLFVHRLLDRCNERVKWNGLETSAYELFMRMNGVDPHDAKEPGGIEKQAAVNPGEKAELKPDERLKLDTDLYGKAAKPLADELNSRFMVDDDVVMPLLRTFQASAAKYADLLRRAGEAPGPTLVKKIEAAGCSGMRVKMKKGLSDNNLFEAERILGFTMDQAAVGVVGGEAKLATDPKPENGQKKVPLEQALRETLVGGKVLSVLIHDAAAAIAKEMGSWFSIDASVIRTTWTNFNNTVNDTVLEQLRKDTGLPRVWAIELLSNAYIHVGGGTLDAAISKIAKKDPTLLGDMGLKKTDIDTRRLMAEAKADQGNVEELNKAKNAAQAAEDQEIYKSPAAELFNGLANVTLNTSDSALQALGEKLKADLLLKPKSAAPANVTAGPVAAPIAEHDPGAKPGGPAHPGQTEAPKTFAEFYRREYGIDPSMHAGQVARALATKERTTDQVGALLGVTGLQYLIAPAAPKEKLELDPNNRTLVAPDFDEREAERRAQKMWDLLHDNGQVQLIRAQIDGRTAEEQRLIHIAFRNLSGGIELSFFMQQHAAAAEKEARAIQDGNLREMPLAVGGGDKALHVVGSKAETLLMVEVAKKGRVSLESRIIGSISGDNMNDVYEAIEKATPEERKAVLANNDLMNRLRKFGDDSYEWQRIYKGLTGQADLFDKLESRAHGRHGFLGGFEATDEKGMSKDIKDHVAERKKALREAKSKALLAELKQKDPKIQKLSPAQERQVAAEVEEALKIEFAQLAENPEIRALFKDELSGAELADREGLLANAGEESKLASVMTEGDMTEDEEKILADLKAMSPAERKKLRNNTEYLNQLHKAIQTQGMWRDAMIILQSDDDLTKDDDNFSILEKASRSSAQDTTEILVEQNQVIEALSKLSPSEYKRLKADPRLQTQILAALERYPDHLARAKAILAYDPDKAIEATGIPTGDKPDPENGIFAKAQIEALAFLKFSAENRILVGASRGWGVLLQAAVYVYNLKLKPSEQVAKPDGAMPKLPGGDAPPPPPDANGATLVTAKAKPAEPGAAASKAADKPGDEKAVPKDHDGEAEKKIRQQILDDTLPAIQGLNGKPGKWFTSESAADDNNQRTSIDPAKQAEIVTKAILKAPDGDPSNHLLLASTGYLGDDEERIKDTLKKAPEEKLIKEWTTIKQHGADDSLSLLNKYHFWRDARIAAKRDFSKTEVPPVNTDEWKKRTSFMCHVIDTSDKFEDMLLKYTGGLAADDAKMEAGKKRVRDNSEWLEWRTIIRERIPSISSEGIITAIGAGNDADAKAILADPTAMRTLSQLEYDEERYAVDRGEVSNYNMDRATAGGQGMALDNAMGDYRREALTSITADPKDVDANKNYGVVDAAEQARIGDAKARFNTADSEFREAKAAVATVAASVVAILITAIVTIFTAGTATGPLVTILLGALTAGASAAGANATREAIQGTDYEFSREGLQDIARQTLMGAVMAGTMWYAGKLTSSLFRASSAAEQAALVGKIAQDPSFFLQMGKGMTENALQTGMQSLFESGMAAFDPAMWLDGWNEGWRRGGEAARARASEIPYEMFKAAVVAALTHTAHAGLGKLKGGGGADEGWHGKHAALGNRMDVTERTDLVLKTMGKGVGEGLIMGGTEIVLDERTYRAGGWQSGEMIGTMGHSVVSMVQQSASNLHHADAAGLARVQAMEKQLAMHGSGLPENHRKIYAELCTKHGGNGTTVLSVPEFQRAMGEMITEGVAEHEAHDNGKKITAEQREAYAKHVGASESLKTYLERAKAGPSGAPGGPPAPAAASFQNNPEACGAARAQAEELLKKLAPLGEATKVHADAVKQMPGEVLGLMNEGMSLVKDMQKTARTDADHTTIRDLVNKINQLSGELRNAIATAQSGSTLQLLHDQLAQQLEAANGAKKDPKVHAALLQLIVSATVREATANSAGENVAIAKQKLVELQAAIAEMTAARDDMARGAGNHLPDEKNAKDPKNTTPETKETKENKSENKTDETKKDEKQPVADAGGGGNKNKDPNANDNGGPEGPETNPESSKEANKGPQITEKNFPQAQLVVKKPLAPGADVSIMLDPVFREYTLKSAQQALADLQSGKMTMEQVLEAIQRRRYEIGKEIGLKNLAEKKLTGEEYQKALEKLNRDLEKLRTPIKDGDPNFDAFSGRPDDGAVAPGTPSQDTRKAIADQIANRFKTETGKDNETLTNKVVLPDGTELDGNKLHRGQKAEDINAQKGGKFGKADPNDPNNALFVTETASPEVQRKCQAAGLKLLGEMLTDREFANAAYLLIMGPVMNRGSDGNIRILLTAAFAKQFDEVPTLPHDIDVQAMSRSQQDFINWLEAAIKKQRTESGGGGGDPGNGPKHDPKQPPPDPKTPATPDPIVDQANKEAGKELKQEAFNKLKDQEEARFKRPLTPEEQQGLEQIIKTHRTEDVERIFLLWIEKRARGMPQDPASIRPSSKDQPKGIVDNAKVGVPGMEIPKEIRRLDGLPPEQAAAEKRFAEQYEKNPDEMAKKYLERVLRGDDESGGNTFATDNAKMLSPDYAPQGVSKEEALAARGMMNLATHQTANAIAKRAFEMRLDQIAADPAAAKQILVTAGGVGAGKTYSIDRVPEAMKLKAESSVVWDSAGEQNSTELAWVIALAKERGLKVAIVYVHRTPEQTWNANPGVISRAIKSGRMVDARLHADSYAEGARNFEVIQQQFAKDPNVKTVVIDSSDPVKGPQKVDRLPQSALEIDANELAAKEREELRKQTNLPGYVKAGGSEIGDKVWGEDSSKAGFIDKVAKGKALGEQHAHTEGSVPVDAVMAESATLTEAQRDAQIAELQQIIKEVAEDKAKFDAKQEQKPADKRKKYQGPDIDDLSKGDGTTAAKVKLITLLDAEAGLIEQLLAAKIALQNGVKAGLPETDLNDLRGVVQTLLAKYRSHLVMRKADMATYPESLNTGLNFFRRYRMIMGHDLTPREIASVRQSADQLGSQELRVGFEGTNLGELKETAKQFNADNEAAKAKGDDTDVSLIINTSKKRSDDPKHAEAMADLVDEWAKDPQMQKAISGLDNAGVENPDHQPILLWKMSAKRAFHNAQTIRQHLYDTVLGDEAKRTAFIESLALVLGKDAKSAERMLNKFLDGDYQGGMFEVGLKKADSAIGVSKKTGAIDETFAGLSIEEVAASTRHMTEALRTFRAETGDATQLPAQLGYTVHAGEQIKGVDPFELLRQVEQVINLGADRIGHALILAIDPKILVQIKQQNPNGPGGLRTDQIGEFKKRQERIREHARQAGVTIEVNITSNTEISNLTGEQHPVANMIDKGLKITVSTDDETTLGTTVKDELQRLAQSRGVDRTDIAIVTLESFASRMGSRELGNRAKLKQVYKDALLNGISESAQRELAERLAKRFHVKVVEGDPGATVDKVLSAVFGV